MSRSKGFSLVELAVALAIIALLLAGALIPFSTQIEVRNVVAPLQELPARVPR